MSNRVIYLNAFVLCCATAAILGCGERKDTARETSFTRIDSLTETYLALQDSMLLMWNRMVDDDNQKIKAMHSLVHELMVSGKTDTEALISIEQRLEQLHTLRYTPETLANTDVVEEYDFAIASLISEVISIAESRTDFTSNSTLQKLSNAIKMMDDRVTIYREEYDSVTLLYNKFIETNQKELKQIDPHDSLHQKPVFAMRDEAI